MSKLSEIIKNESIQTNPTDLSNITKKAEQIIHQQKVVENLEEDLKKAKKDLLFMTDQELPDMMMEINLKDFKLDTGFKIEIKNLYGASIRKDREQEAFSWLRNNGYGDIVKNIVSVTFAMGEDQKAQDFISATAKTLGDIVPEKKQKVEPSTLKKFVKEQIESGESFPTELFGAFTGQRAIINKGDK